MKRADTMSLAECAEHYGATLDWWYHNWRRLVAAGMPDRVSPVGHPRFPRARWLAWCAGVLPPAAANDVAPTAEPTLEQVRDELARTYRQVG